MNRVGAGASQYASNAATADAMNRVGAFSSQSASNAAADSAMSRVADAYASSPAAIQAAAKDAMDRVGGASSLAGLIASNTDAMDRIGKSSAAGALQSGYSSGAGDMRSAFTSGQGLPQSMLDSAFPNFQSLLSQGVGALGDKATSTTVGANPVDFSPVMSALASGYGTVNQNIRDQAGSINANYGNFLGSNSGLAGQIGSGTMQKLDPLLTTAYNTNRAQNNAAYAAQDARSNDAYRNTEGVLSNIGSQGLAGFNTSNQNVNGLLATLATIAQQGKAGFDTSNQNVNGVLGSLTGNRNSSLEAMNAANGSIGGIMGNIGSLINQGQGAIIGTGAPDEVSQYTRSRDGYNNANQNVRDVMTNMGNAYYSQPVLTSGRQEFSYNNYPQTPAAAAPRRVGRI